jgi:hypothetical protein
MITTCGRHHRSTAAPKQTATTSRSSTITSVRLHTPCRSGRRRA